MNKAAPSFGRIAAMVVFALSCFGLLLFLWLAFGGPIPLKPQGYRFQTSFAEATQLATEADVRISGVPVGRVKTIEPDNETGRSIVVIELQSRYAPMPSDARAILRQKTLLGETYVELTPGSRDAEPVPEGGSLPESQISDTVQLDEIYRTFDPETRAAFQTWMQEQARGISGYGRDLNDALGNLGAVRRGLRRAGRHPQPPGGRRHEPDLEHGRRVRGADRAGRPAALADRELQPRLPGHRVARRAAQGDVHRAAHVRARVPADARAAGRVLRRHRPADHPARPAARELSPTLQDLGALSPDLEALFRELNPLIDASVKGFPAAERVLADARPLIAQLDPAMRQLGPIVDFLGLYKPELTAFLANTPAATQAKDTSGIHYLRTVNPLNPENLAVYPRRIGSNRTNPYTKPGLSKQLRGGMDVFDDRHCGAGQPSITNVRSRRCRPRSGIWSRRSCWTGSSSSASEARRATCPRAPCRLQGPYNFGGQVTQYPHVRAR